MLPQKLCPATTWIRPERPMAGDPPPHALVASASTSSGKITFRVIANLHEPRRASGAGLSHARVLHNLVGQVICVAVRCLQSAAPEPCHRHRPRPVRREGPARVVARRAARGLSLIHISEPTRLGMISYAVFCLKKKKK